MDKQAEKNLFAELRVGNEKAYKLLFKYEFESFFISYIAFIIGLKMVSKK